jgi:hypothetical protein
MESVKQENSKKGFYCQTCQHQYTNTTPEKHKETKTHTDKLVKRKVCLL